MPGGSRRLRLAGHGAAGRAGLLLRRQQPGGPFYGGPGQELPVYFDGQRGRDGAYEPPHHQSGGPLVLVSDPSWRGIQAARRLKDLAQALKIVVGRPVLIVNRVTNGLSPKTQSEIEVQGLELAGFIPEDPLIADFDSQGRPTYTLPPESPALQAAYAICARLLA